MKITWVLSVLCMCLEFEVIRCIIGGRDAEHGEYPYQVSIRLQQSDYHWCGGAILNQRFIITSAICANLHSAQNKLYVIAGLTTMYESGTKIDITNITVHPHFVKGKLDNNIALLRTAKRIKYTKYIGSVGLPNVDVPFEGGSQVVITGYGYTETGLRNDILRSLNTRILSKKNCKNQYIEADLAGRTIDESTTCTKNVFGAGICHFDEGSPLVDANTSNLVGIASWIGSYPQCAEGLPDVYTRVFAYVEWIQKVLNGNKEEPKPEFSAFPGLDNWTHE